MTISLAKVFNKDITKKELEKIILDLKKDLKENPDSEKYKDFESMCWSIVEKLDDVKLNLLILGKTGTGKSSLVNALVGKEVAKVGGVKPETPYGIFLYETEIDGKKVNIYDSWGIERNEDAAKKWKELIKDELRKRGVDKDIKDWFHSVTYCTHVGVDRLEPFEKEIIKELLKEKYEVVIAITKADRIITPEEKNEYDKYIEDIKKITGVNRVVKVAVNPVKSIIMTETPKPFGLPEYKEAILISWKKIFIDKIPNHIIEKLKKDIYKGELDAPRKGKDLEKLAKEIQDYFNDILIKNTKKYIKESIIKYCSITGNMININQNINIKNVDYGRGILDFESELADVYSDIIDFGDFVKNIPRIPIAAIKDLCGIIYFKIKGKKDNISIFIIETSMEYTKRISEKEFEDKIRKIIKDILDNNIAKSIYYRILNFIIDIFNKIKKYIKKSN